MNNDGRKTANQHMIRLKFFSLKSWADAFLRDCRVRDLSPFTIEYYTRQLAAFDTFARTNDVIEVTDITADVLRSYLIHLEETNHNAGGRHAKYRALRAFLHWYEREAEPDDWTNPLAKVKPPKVTHEPIEPVSVADIQAILKTCDDNFTGVRDRAILLCLLDTGARVREFLSLDLDDVDLIGGSVIVCKTKNKKPRTVFLGKRSRKALRFYLRQREDDCPALWVTSTGSGLAVKSLQGMLERRAKTAGVTPPSPHDFRRSFALLMLRANVDVFSLQRLMGHSDLSVLRRYLAQTTDDLRAAHERGSPVDKLF